MTTDDIALLIEIPGVYAGSSAYLLKDGRLVNRWDGTPFTRRRRATQSWLERNGDALRAVNADLLDQTARAAVAAMAETIRRNT